MGCGQTKMGKGEQQEMAMRKVLSITGDLGPETREATDRATDAETGLLIRLCQEQVLHILDKGADALNTLGKGTVEDGHDDDMAMGKRFSIVSETDQQMAKVPSFSSKTISKVGDTTAHQERLNVGYACKKGLKPESPNQDSFFILQVESEYSIYGVFDGHGRKGHDVSNFVKECLPKLLLMDPDLPKNPLTALKKAFEKTQQLIVRSTELNHIDASRSGTTCSVIFYDHRLNTLHIAHVGDSRCVLARSASLGEKDAKAASSPPAWEAVDLTQDHKPDTPQEKARIEAAGGKVVYDGFRNHRVYAKHRKGPGLNMSRAMGDLVGHFHAGISASPDVKSHVVESDDGGGQAFFPPAGDSKEQPGLGDEPVKSDSVSSVPSLTSYRVQSSDKFILLCSDGVWEFLSSLDAVQIISDFAAKDVMAAADRLSGIAWDRWIKEMGGQVVDDITVVLVRLLDTAVVPRPGNDDHEIARIHLDDDMEHEVDDLIVTSHEP